MKLTTLKYKILEQEPGLIGMYKAAELPGRICYGSMDKMTPESAQPFVERLIKANHGAPLEHATVYLTFSEEQGNKTGAYEFYTQNKFTKTHFVTSEFGNVLFVTTNLRVLLENNRLDDLKYWSEPTKYHEKRIMVRFTSNIGVNREYNRHRADSMNEESTRYCNYSKDKYENELTIVFNENKFADRPDEVDYDVERKSLKDFCQMILDDTEFDDVDYWVFANKAAEWSYIGLTTEWGWKAQDARDILPLDLKSSLIHTAFVEDWMHFFNLRAKGTTGAPHPQAKELAEPLMYEFIERGYIPADFATNTKYNNL